MTKQTDTSANRQSRPAATQEIGRDRWIAFLPEFTRENRGAHARLEVVGPEIGSQIEVEDKALEGISVDTKDGENAVWITFVSTPEEHVTHGVHQVAAIRMRPPTGQSGPVLEIVAHDQTTTLLALSLPGTYALPAATS